MRDFSTLFSQGVLKMIIDQLNESFDNSRYDIRFDFNQNVFDIISDVVKYYGLSDVTWDEATFFSELVKLNPDYETEKINVPIKNTYEIDVNVDMIEYVTETYRHTLESYVSKDEELLKEQLMNDQDYSYWSGQNVNRDVYDSQTNEEKIEYITKI